jgi:hypothetical protein
MQTIWSDAGTFLDQYLGREEPDTEMSDPIACLEAFFAEMKGLNP